MPIPTRKTPGGGPRGLATVKVLKNNVKVIMTDDEKEYTFNFEDVRPDWLANGLEHAVGISADGTKLYNARPAGGVHAARFVHFAASKDEPPMPKMKEFRSGTKNGKPWQIPQHEEFSAIMEIVGGDFYGQELVYNMWYGSTKGWQTFSPWEEDEDVAVLTAKGKYYDQVYNFLTLAGIDWETDTIIYSDNVLPELEELLQTKKNAIFLIEMNGQGWVDNLMELPSGMKPAKTANAKDITKLR